MIEMTDITLNDITSGYNVSRINVNFEVVEEVINNEVLHKVGGNNTMLQDLDMNSYTLLNVKTDLTDPGSIITLGDADLRYYNVTGDTLTGTMNVSGQTVTGLKQPVGPTEAVRKDQLDTEVAARAAADSNLYNGYTSADANIQAQLTGNVPLEASAFSPISWHDQSVDSSVSVPASKNAWSFGPTMTISLGQVVTIGAGSFWTIANGEVV
jgi:hypothetical protein